MLVKRKGRKVVQTFEDFGRDGLLGRLGRIVVCVTL